MHASWQAGTANSMWPPCISLAAQIQLQLHLMCCLALQRCSSGHCAHACRLAAMLLAQAVGALPLPGADALPQIKTLRQVRCGMRRCKVHAYMHAMPQHARYDQTGSSGTLLHPSPAQPSQARWAAVAPALASWLHVLWAPRHAWQDSTTTCTCMPKCAARAEPAAGTAGPGAHTTACRARARARCRHGGRQPSVAA